MSAEILRRAAALMRERAEAAPSREGWVYVDVSSVWVLNDPDGNSADCFIESFPIWAEGAGDAGMEPAVALAVADWLERIAARADEIADTIGSERVAASVIASTLPGWDEALTVARTYLGEPA